MQAFVVIHAGPGVARQASRPRRRIEINPTMTGSLQVTYRKGRPLAAYLHLSHKTGEKSTKAVPSPDGLLVVDYPANRQPVRVEITAPLAISLGDVVPKSLA